MRTGLNTGHPGDRRGIVMGHRNVAILTGDHLGIRFSQATPGFAREPTGQFMPILAAGESVGSPKPQRVGSGG